MDNDNGPLSSQIDRRFYPQRHIRNLLTGEFVHMYDGHGQVSGVRGVAGVSSLTQSGEELGIDLIEMEPGSEFRNHTHPGDHILYVLSGQGLIHFDGEDYPIREGDSVFVAAQWPHSVKTHSSSNQTLRILAVGLPHKEVGAENRATSAIEAVEDK